MLSRLWYREVVVGLGGFRLLTRYTTPCATLILVRCESFPISYLLLYRYIRRLMLNSTMIELGASHVVLMHYHKTGDDTSILFLGAIQR